MSENAYVLEAVASLRRLSEPKRDSVTTVYLPMVRVVPLGSLDEFLLGMP